MALASAPYNLSIINRLKRRHLLINLGKALSVVVVLLAGLAFLGDYLAHVPVERSQRNFSYLQRLEHGAKMTWLSFLERLNTQENSARDSQLPSVHLSIAGRNLDALNGNLPQSGREYQSALIKLDGKEYKAKVRYRGDSLNHWAFPQKSWRIKLTRGKSYKGMQYFNLYQPRTQNQLSEQLSYDMADRMGGILAPRAFYTHFRLNRRFDGIRMFLEQVNEDFLAARGRLPGDILVGDISTEDIYTTSMHNRKLLFGPQDATNWETISLNLDQGTADVALTEHPTIKGLLAVLNSPMPVESFEKEVLRYIDLESTLRYMALLEIVGSMHIDATHNHKWYLDPSSGVLSPIVWDPLAYLWGDRPGIDLDHNLLFRKILTSPTFRLRKNQIVWDAVNGPLHEKIIQPYLKETADSLRQDVYDNPFKVKATRTQVHFNTNEDWEAGVKNIIAVVKSRNDKIRRFLSTFQGASFYSSTDKTLSIEVASHSGVKLNSARFALATPVTPGKVVPVNVRIQALHGNETERTELFLKLAVSQDDNRTIDIPFDDVLLSARFLKTENGRLGSSPSISKYLIKSSLPLASLESIHGINPVTGKEISIKISPTALNAAAPNGIAPKPNSKNVEISGTVELQEDLIVNPGERLIVKAGSVISLADHVSIIASGAEVLIQGTLEKPVVFQRKNSKVPWGVLGISRSPLTKISHTRIKGGSFSTISEAYFPAALSVHHSSVKLDNVTIDDGELSTQFSTGRALNVTTDTPSGVPHHREGSGVIFDPPLNVKRTYSEHSRSYIDSPAVGTPPRVEREYKYAITKASVPSLGKVPLAELVKLTGEVLQQASLDASRWKAPAFALEPAYRVATAVEANVYRDIYMDTPDNRCYLNDISYRLRHRFGNKDTHDSHIRNPENPRFWPYRLEFQAKTGREVLAPGLSAINEARLEFRKQSKPFDGDSRRPPPPPWTFDEYLPWMASGTFRGAVGTPGKHVVETLSALYPQDNSWRFEPRVAVVSERGRAHFQLKTPWGSGPNPDQAFIITIDKAAIYPASRFIDFIHSSPHQTKKTDLEPSGTLLEFEIEFERNVSVGVIGDKEKLEAAHQAFLQDQEQILHSLKEGLAKYGYSLNPMNRSKYLQALDIVNSDKNLT